MPRVIKNDAPARFTGNFFRWIAETPDGTTYCDTREVARNVVREWRRERARLLREYERIQARQMFLYD